MHHTIRLATIFDCEAILNIYAPYIRNSAISFEIEVPTINEFSYRIRDICKQYPYLVYVVNGKIVGYAYASKHRERAAYCYDVDVSIYVLPQYHGLGIAYQLYGCLFDILKKQGYYNAYAAYTIPNDKSMRFHKKLGFVNVGTYYKTGYKFGKWHDVVWVEKSIMNHNVKPLAIKSISELPLSFCTIFFYLILFYVEKKTLCVESRG